MTTYTTNYNLEKYEGTDKPNLRDQYNSAMDKIDTELKDLADTDTQTATNVLNLQNRMNTAEGDISALQSDNTTNKSNISSLTGRMSTAETNITEIQGSVNTNTENITNLTSRVTAAEGSITAAQSDITELQGDMDEAKNDISSLETSIANIGLGMETLTLSPKSTTGVENLTVSGTFIIRRNIKLHIANLSFVIHVKNSSSSPVVLPADTILYHASSGWEPSSNLIIGQGSLFVNVSSNNIGVNAVGFKTNGDLSLNQSGAITIPASSECIFYAFQPLLFTQNWGTNY